MATSLLSGNQYFTTTLNVGGGIDASQTTGIIVADVSGLDTTKPGIALVNYATPLNTSICEWIEYTSINGSKELQGVIRGSEGFSAKTHSNGVSVAFPLSESHINRLATALSIGASAANGVEGVLDEDDMATNSATKLATQQSIKAYVDAAVATSSTDGWTSSSDTLVYASASTVTISGVDRTTIYQKGTKVKFTQTTAKYFVVASSTFSTNTTITFMVNTDYTVANAAITLPYYSYQENPQGYPTDFTYAPTINGTGGSIGTYAATTYFSKYYVTGRRVHMQFSIQVTNLGSWSGQIQLSTPVACSSSYTGTYNNPVNCYITASANIPVAASLATGSVIQSGTVLQFISSMGTTLIPWSSVSANFVFHGEFSYLF